MLVTWYCHLEKICTETIDLFRFVNQCFKVVCVLLSLRVQKISLFPRLIGTGVKFHKLKKPEYFNQWPPYPVEAWSDHEQQTFSMKAVKSIFRLINLSYMSRLTVHTNIHLNRSYLKPVSLEEDKNKYFKTWIFK